MTIVPQFLFFPPGLPFLPSPCFQLCYMDWLILFLLLWSCSHFCKHLTLWIILSQFPLFSAFLLALSFLFLWYPDLFIPWVLGFLKVIYLAFLSHPCITSFTIYFLVFLSCSLLLGSFTSVPEPYFQQCLKHNRYWELAVRTLLHLTQWKIYLATFKSHGKLREVGPFQNIIRKVDRAFWKMKITSLNMWVENVCWFLGVHLDVWSPERGLTWT